MKKIIVIGSLNMDSVIETMVIPKAGETVAGKSLVHVPGGKGANQAYALGKLGGDVSMIGALGNDAFGKELKKNLETVNVDTSGIELLEDEISGQAFVFVDKKGENSIISISGTNGLVSKKMIEKNKKIIEYSDIVIMQMEIPAEVVEYAKEIAKGMGKMVIIDPSPVVEGLPDSFWRGVDYIKPNEIEFEMLTGHTVNTEEELSCGARKMLSKGIKGVIVTLGKKGCWLVTADVQKFFPAKKVKAIDTTAAGDSFMAGFALAISQGMSLDKAIRFGQKVSAIAVTRRGAQTSIPTLDELGNL